MITTKETKMIDAAIEKAIRDNYVGNEYDEVLYYCEHKVMNAIDRKGIENIWCLYKYVYTVAENAVDYYFKWIEI